MPRPFLPVMSPRQHLYSLHQLQVRSCTVYREHLFSNYNTNIITNHLYNTTRLIYSNLTVNATLLSYYINYNSKYCTTSSLRNHTTIFLHCYISTLHVVVFPSRFVLINVEFLDTLPTSTLLSKQVMRVQRIIMSGISCV